MAVALLLRARNDATAEDVGTIETANRLQRGIRSGVVLARQEARQRGVARLEAEATSAGVDIRIASGERLAALGLARDWERGTFLGRSYANRWLRKARELEDARAASAATRGSLDRIAVSESSEAFSSGRDAAIEAEPATVVEILKVWDATLDRRTCPVCSDADGTIVGLSESFPAGEPGAVHALCRCGFSIMTKSESRSGILIKSL